MKCNFLSKKKCGSYFFSVKQIICFFLFLARQSNINYFRVYNHDHRWRYKTVVLCFYLLLVRLTFRRNSPQLENQVFSVAGIFWWYASTGSDWTTSMLPWRCEPAAPIASENLNFHPNFKSVLFSFIFQVLFFFVCLFMYFILCAYVLIIIRHSFNQWAHFRPLWSPPASISQF